MSDQQIGNRSTKVFISYSRRDILFVRKLNAALDAAGIEAWVDWEGIPYSADWMAEIARAIEGADAFLFVMSPDSLASRICAEELELGIKNNKKLIPILYREAENRKKMHPLLRKTNWVYLRPKKDDFKTTIPRLIDTIHTDLGWVQQHTRLLQRASEWNHKNRDTSYLLQGADLEDAEKWMTESASGTNRDITPLQAEYIGASRRNAVKRQRQLLTGVALAFVISVAMGVYAVLQRNDAVENEMLAKTSEANAIAKANEAATQRALAISNEELALQKENEAKAQRSAAQAKIYESRPGELDTSTLLALESWRRLPSNAAEDILRRNISLMPMPVAQMSQGGGIWNIHMSADGAYFASASADGTACVWATADGTKQFCVTHKSDVYDALLDPESNSLITSSADGTLQFWDWGSTDAQVVFEFGTKVWDIDLSPDNKWVSVGRADGGVTLINNKSRKETVSFNLAAGEIYVAAFDPSSEWLAIGTSEGYITLWRVNTGFSKAGPKHTSEVYAIAFSRDGKWLASGGADSAARLAKTESGGQKFALPHADWVEDVAFGPHGSWFVTVSDDNLVRVWDTEKGVEKLRMEHGGFVQRVEVSPNGEWIATTGFDRTVRIWDSASGSLAQEISLDDTGSALAFSPDGNRLIVGDRAGNISIWDLSALKARIGYIEFPEFVHKAKFNSTGDWVLFNSDDKNIWQLPASELTTVHNGTAGTKVLSLKNISGQFKISPDSKWIVVSETYGAKAVLYNLETQDQRSLPLPEDVTGLAFSWDSGQVAITYKDGKEVLTWSVGMEGEPVSLPFDAVTFTSSYSPIDPILAIGVTGRTILWDTSTNSELASLAQLGEIRSLTFSKDGTWLATTSTEGSIFLWDMKNRNYDAPAYSFLQGGSISSLDFSGNNQWLASGSKDGFAYLWNLTTGEEVARLPHSHSVTSVSFSADSTMLMTVSRKVVQIWDINAVEAIEAGSIAEEACARLVSNMSLSEWKFFFNDEEYHKTCPNLPEGK
jgi:WD40 repeat protein